jgi:hypothetical protein
MSVRTGVGAAGIVYVASKTVQRALTPEHNNLLKDTFSEVDWYASANRTLLVDHINPSGSDGRPPVVNGARPDLELRDFKNPNLIVEVETAATLDGDAKSQLEAFRKPSYTRVLVVPDGTIKDGERLVADLPGDVIVTTPNGIAEIF